MKPIRIIHIADVHFCKRYKDKALASLETVIKTAEEKGVDLFCIAGDLFDSGIQNVADSGFPELVQMIKRMMDLAPVVVVTGTPTHDIPGCYEVFTQIEAFHNFMILQPGIEYFLAHPSQQPSFVSAEPWAEDDNLLILGLPEPQKTWYLKDKRMGRDHANEEITQGLRELLLGMGAIRKEYPDIPCLFVGHMNVAGASMCNGQLVRQGEIVVGRDDLAMVGADYYALGHIHLSQEVSKEFPMFYAGSAYPVDWGETDQKSFNYIEMKEEGEKKKVIVNKISFPHPPRKKIVYIWNNKGLPHHWDSADDPISESSYEAFETIEGYQVWQDYRATKEQAREINTDEILQKMLAHGALPGSRVTTSVIPSETVRAWEIQEAKALRGKVKIYHENTTQNGEDITSVLDKADQIEAEAKKEGLTGEGLHIRLKSVRLRGAIGIWKGQGKEEIEVNFEDFDPGLIALIGKNGAGKTTLIENMHPYPCMLTRSGKLQDHFFLRDSFREIIFVDEKTGDEYRSYITIDGKNKTGKAEYFLYKNGQPITNGRSADYEEKVTELFGSRELFLRSAFVTQKATKNNPDLAEATKGEKKAIFTELAGIDYLQVYSDMAKAKKDMIDQDITAKKNRLEMLKDAETILTEKQKEKNTLEMLLKIKKAELKTLEIEGKKLAEKKAEAEKIVKKNQEIQSQIKSDERLIDEKENQKDELEQEVSDLSFALQERESAEDTIKNLEELTEKERELLQRKVQISEENQAKTAKYNKEMQDFQEKKREYEDVIQTCRNQIEKNNIQIKVIGEKLDQFVICPSCGFHFSPAENKKELEEEQKALNEDNNVQNLEIKNFQCKLDELLIPLEPQLNFEYEKIDNELDQIQMKLRELRSGANIQEAREILTKAENAEDRIKKITANINEIVNSISFLSDQIKDLKKAYDSAIDTEYVILQSNIEKTRAEYTEKRAEIAGDEQRLKDIEETINLYKKHLDEITTLKNDIKVFEKEYSEWAYLQKACGRDGIQALELDALAPGIADIANRLLESAYGSEFRIEFRTTRIAGSGSKTKQVEDFQIMIHRGDEVQELDTLSGGEAIWIKKAIYDAFGIIRARNTGIQFLSCFQDEADGALDPEAKTAYFQMLEAAHQESGRHHTILITHSPAIQQMISQKIEMSELEEKAAVAA